MTRTRTALGRKSFAIAVLGGACALAGCGIDRGGGVFIGNLEVQWNIAGSTSPVECDNYDISTWRVSLRGPVIQDSTVDCRIHEWTTADDFFEIDEGVYDITVRALDSYNQPIVDLQASYDVISQTGVQVVGLNFKRSDFQ